VNWEAAAIDLLTAFAAGVETCRLYSSEHPRFDWARRRLSSRIDSVFDLPMPDGERPPDASEVEVAVVQRELFFQGQPFTRVGEQMAVIVRALHRHRIDRIAFRNDVPEQEVAKVLEFLAGSQLEEVPEFSHVVVGSAVSLAGDGGRRDARPLDLPGRIDTLSTVVRTVARDRPPPLPGAYRVAESLDREIQKASDPIGLLAPLEDADEWLMIHAHNTAALALSMAVALDLDAERRHEIGVSAVLHDIGKFGMAEELIRHDLDLTGAEWELNFNHPQIGLERLLEVPQAPEIACIVAFDHHLRNDGGGYPTTPQPRPPHPAAAMVAVAEATDIMLTVRVARGGMEYGAVTETLLDERGKAFDSYLAGIMAAILRVPRYETC